MPVINNLPFETYKIRDIKTNKIINLTGIINPLKIDNRNICSVADNQGDTPHCSAYAVGNYIESIHWKRTGKLINLDSTKIFERGHELQHRATDGLDLEFAVQGALDLAGYDKDKVEFEFVRSDDSIDVNVVIETCKFLVHKYDFVLAGFSITNGWKKEYVNKDYTIKDSNKKLGNHSVLICGYDTNGVYIQNSWGKNWAFKSFAIVPWNIFNKTFRYGCCIKNVDQLI